MPEAAPVPRGPWPAGINNRADELAMPVGTVRDSINVDPSREGIFSLRTGYTIQAPGTSIRGALSIGRQILLADGESLVCFDSTTNSSVPLGPIAGAGRFTGDVFNAELFFCTENECLRYKDGVLRSWGVTTVSYQPVPVVVAGGLVAGEYQCAATFVDAYGDEGGTTAPLQITLGENAGLQFTLPTPPEGGSVRLYVSPVQGGELYLQYQGVGAYLCTSVATDSARLETLNLRAPVPGDFICEHNGSLAIAEGKTLWLTEPLRPHLRNQAKRFYQFPKPIDGIVSADGGLFVLSDKSYFLSAAESDQPLQTDPLDYGGVRGSMMKVIGPPGPNGITLDYATWMTQYGLARSDGQGGVILLSAANFLPEISSHGSSGFIEHNGNQLVVHTLHRTDSDNTLRANDYSEAEIVTP